MTFVLLLGLMLVGHAIADSWLQPFWLSRKKRDPNPVIQITALAVHGSVHALPVAMVTGSAMLAAAELFLHPLIDYLKSLGWYGLKTDQVLHVVCKAAWALIVLRDPAWLA